MDSKLSEDDTKVDIIAQLASKGKTTVGSNISDLFKILLQARNKDIREIHKVILKLYLALVNWS